MAYAAALRYTYRDYLLTPEGTRYELIDGNLLVTPSPSVSHQRISRRIDMALVEHVEAMDLGEVFYSPCDVVLTDEDVVQPDLLFVSKARASIIGEKAIQGAPDLVVEILSPGTEERDRGPKLKLYGRHGVKEIWLVDPSGKTIDVFVTRRRRLELAGRYAGTDEVRSVVLSDLKLSLTRVF